MKERTIKFVFLLLAATVGCLLAMSTISKGIDEKIKCIHIYKTDHLMKKLNKYEKAFLLPYLKLSDEILLKVSPQLQKIYDQECVSTYYYELKDRKWEVVVKKPNESLKLLNKHRTAIDNVFKVMAEYKGLHYFEFRKINEFNESEQFGKCNVGDGLLGFTTLSSNRKFISFMDIREMMGGGGPIGSYENYDVLICKNVKTKEIINIGVSYFLEMGTKEFPAMYAYCEWSLIDDDNVKSDVDIRVFLDKRGGAYVPRTFEKKGREYYLFAEMDSSSMRLSPNVSKIKN